MSSIVKLTHDYPYSGNLVWEVSTDLDHLKAVTKGLLTFRSLPSGKIYEGQQIKVDVSLFGVMPYQPYEMNVVQFDADKRTFTSSEIGAGVRSWCHHLRVVDVDNGSRIEECIEIDAGRMTPLFAAWARFMYRKRHQPRLKILKTLS